MYKFAAIGDFENTAYFGAIGAETFFPESKEDAQAIIKRLSQSGYAVIFVNEKYYEDSYGSDVLTAVIPLPSGKGSNTRISTYVKRAIGSDMNFDS